MNIINISILLLTFVAYFFYYRKYLHILQLEGYKPHWYMRWCFDNAKKLYVYQTIIAIISVILYLVFEKINIPAYLSAIPMLALYGYEIYGMTREKFKKPLVYTWRARRIFITGFILLTILLGIGYTASLFFSISSTYIYLIIFAFVFGIAADDVYIANFILKPVEKFCGLKYINEAKKIIDIRTDLIKIGITGSYGKTSTKFILKTILDEKYNTYATPDSYNSTMGNVRVIREQITNLHQVYIAEMGARKPGDIKEICDIVKPQYGIITSIGNQHLETFKNVETIIRTKYELIASLPEDSVAFFPDDHSHCKALYNKEEREKILYGTPESDYYAKDITVSEHGSTFTVVCNTDNTEFVCTTKILGIHNISNILGCIAIAKQLGLTNQEIARGVSKIAPIPHRLELIPNDNGLTIIDDAFNSNPWGAKAALDVMSNFKGRKIIITPGMIELGDEQYSANFEFGKQIAAVCDIAILVGKKLTVPIQEGIQSTLFDTKNMYVVSSLDEATQILSQVGQLHDTVLFENDLPDTFNE